MSYLETCIHVEVKLISNKIEELIKKIDELNQKISEMEKNNKNI